MLPAASLGTDDGYSSFGPSATCSRPALKTSAAAVLASAFMAPLTVAGGEGMQMVSYKHGDGT